MDTRQSYYNRITIKYNTKTKNVISKYCKLNSKLINATTSRIFLLKCKHDKITPEFITNISSKIESFKTCSKLNRSYDNIITVLNKKLHNLEIKKQTLFINNTRRLLSDLEQKISGLINKEDFEEFLNNQSKFMEKQRQDGKHRRLLDRTVRNATDMIRLNEKAIVNTIPTLEVPKDVQTILSFGPKFNLPVNTRNLPMIDILADIEQIVTKIEDDDPKDLLRTDCSDIMKSYLKKNHTKSRMDVTLEEYLKNTRTFIKNHPEIYVLNADKGNITVLMDANLYKAKMREMLEE